MLNVESTVRAHASPNCSIHDITESLASDLLAKFPAALETSINFTPDIRRNFSIENLATASCAFYRLSPRIKCPAAEQTSTYRIQIEWQLPISLQSGCVISLSFSTEERSVSPVHHRPSNFNTSGFRSSLEYVHPSFGLHEKVARFAQQSSLDRAEGAALLLAQCLFYLADSQSPCKRLEHVSVTMREVPPLMNIHGTKAEQMIEKRGRGYIQDSFTQCNVQLGRHQYEQSRRSSVSSDAPDGRHRAYLALGSNIGNRVKMIESAIRAMCDRRLTVLRTSALYETKPMYLENQESFINGACEVCSDDEAASLRPSHC